MAYEAPIKNYSYPYSTNTEIGWPWCDDNSIDELNKDNNPNKILDFLPKCQCKNINMIEMNNNYNNVKDDTTKYDLESNNNIDNDNSLSSQNFLRTEKLINTIQKHGSDKFRLRNPMTWWGGCIESLP